MVSGPITPHGSVVVNAAYDFAQYAKAINPATTLKSNWPGDAAYHRIHKKELVFRHRDTSKRKRTSYNEPDLHVFSVCNGLEGKSEGIAHTRNLCSFIGVSNTDLEVGSVRHASVLVAGLVTVENTGHNRIDPGDKLVWDVPQIDGKAGRKLFQILPYHCAVKEAHVSHCLDVGEKLSEGVALDKDNTDAGICAKAARRAGITQENFKSKEFQLFLKLFTEVTKEVDSRVIGTAMSKADIDQKVDILVRHAH